MGEVAESKVDRFARFSFFSSTIRSSPVPVDDDREQGRKKWLRWRRGFVMRMIGATMKKEQFEVFSFHSEFAIGGGIPTGGVGDCREWFGHGGYDASGRLFV